MGEDPPKSIIKEIDKLLCVKYARDKWAAIVTIYAGLCCERFPFLRGNMML